MKNATSTPRRQPAQERGKRTVENILQAAEALIAEEGAGELKMRGIAERAGIPIGSLYMYFPNRESIIRAITDHYHALIDADLQSRVAEIHTNQELLQAVESCVDDYFEFIRSTPAVLHLWTGSTYNQLLAQLSIEDSLRTAGILHQAALPFLPSTKVEQARHGFLVCVDMIGSISLVAASLAPASGKKMVAEMRKMIVGYVTELLKQE